MGLFQAVGQQYTAIWNRLSAGHKIILILLCLVCAGATVGVVFWAGTPDYQVLYTDLSAKDCASLVAGLKDAGIKARIGDGGTSIMVPAGKINEARMAAAEKGVPSAAHGGFEAFREPKIGMSPFAERVNYINALQEELASTIASLDSVMYARVHLVVPERALFKKDQRKASASVLVMTKGGVSENVCIGGMIVPGEGIKGLKKFVVDAVIKAGAQPCPPNILGVAMGGGADTSM
jgi:flagellar M-ring protein FliF